MGGSPSLDLFYLLVKEQHADGEKYGALLKWYSQGQTVVLGGNPDPVPLCPPQISHWMAWNRNRASAMKDRSVIAWDIS